MKKRIINKIALFLAFFFLLSPKLEAGWQQCMDIKNAKLPSEPTDSQRTQNGYSSNVFVTTDSGENWSNITVGITSSFFGSAANDIKSGDNYANDIDKTTGITGDTISSGTALSDEMLEEPLNKAGLTYKKANGFSSVTVTSYLVKITKYVKYNTLYADGKKSVNVSREKLIEGLYNLKYSGSDLIKSFYFYRLETEKGIVTKQGFC